MRAAVLPTVWRDRRGVAVVAALLVVGLIAWTITVDRMAGMDAGPGTDLGRLGWFTGVWTTMMAAMMLPAAAPVVVLFNRAAPRGSQRSLTTAAFVAGYLLVWITCGIVAYAVYRAIGGLEPAFMSWESGGPWVAGGTVAAAGLYQLTPLKRVCLRHCRSPMHYLLARWRAGPTGAVRMGARHGLFCVGCCSGLMVVLFAVGVMSIFWMVVVATVIFVEKVLPAGEWFARLFAVILVVIGVWLAVAPASVPNLTQPVPTMEM